MLARGNKYTISINSRRTFIGNGSGGVEGFIEANSQPKGRIKSPYQRAKEYKTYTEKVNRPIKLDLSNVKNLKKITKVVSNNTNSKNSAQ